MQPWLAWAMLLPRKKCMLRRMMHDRHQCCITIILSASTSGLYVPQHVWPCPKPSNQVHLMPICVTIVLNMFKCSTAS